MISFFPYSWVISHCVYIPHFFFNHLSMVFSLLNRTFENFHSKYVCTQLPTFLMLDVFRTPFKFAAWWLLIKAKESIQNSRLAIQISSVTQLCRTLCDPMNCSTPGLPVHHQLMEFTQIHVHRVSDAIQPSHPLSSPSPPAPNPSQHQSLFQWVNSSHEVAKVLEFRL